MDYESVCRSQSEQIFTENMVHSLEQRVDFLQKENEAKMEVINSIQKQLLKASVERDQFLDETLQVKAKLAE